MKIGLLLFLSLVSCSTIEVTSEDTNLEDQKSNSIENEPVDAFVTGVNEHDNLFIVEYLADDGIFQITPPIKNDFALPDSSIQFDPYKMEDFNGDNQKDLMFDFGACGTGGCVYGIFINQYEKYYRLAYMDYLKGPQFEKEIDGTWSISSYEEVEAYDPSRLHVAVFKFDEEIYSYELDTTYIFYDTIQE